MWESENKKKFQPFEERNFFPGFRQPVVERSSSDLALAINSCSSTQTIPRRSMARFLDNKVPRKSWPKGEGKDALP